MKARRPKRKIEPLLIAPMIDVIFQLVLFLLVSSSFKINPAIPIALPKSSTARGTENGAIEITLASNGDLSLNGTKVSIDTFSKYISELDSSMPVTLSADASCANGTVVFIFDELRKNGFSEVNLRTSGF